MYDQALSNMCNLNPEGEKGFGNQKCWALSVGKSGQECGAF